ncbi:MAG TPA: cytochrome c [Terracidiphilus sp.]|jgi:mono/diheme cytochrome c family protein
MLKPLLLLPAVVFLAIGAASNPTPAAQEGTAAKGSKSPTVRAKEIYNFDCAICHAANGNGKSDLAKDMQLTLTDFTDPKTFEGKSDDQLFDLIRKGKDKMPAEDAGRAKNEEIKAIVQYIRSFSKDQPAAPASAPAPQTAPSSAPTSPGSN